MIPEQKYLQFVWGDRTYAVAIEDVGGVVPQKLFKAGSIHSSGLARTIPNEFSGKIANWVIILQNEKINLAISVDKVIGVVTQADEDSFGSKFSPGLFRIWQVANDKNDGKKKVNKTNKQKMRTSKGMNRMIGTIQHYSRPLPLS